VFGSAEGGQATDLSVNAFRTVVEIDLVGSFQVSKATLPLLRAAVADGEPAAIVNISVRAPLLAFLFFRVTLLG
jgi:NAD(P)-dependent dehydrogenase (short-subunit alcohol dehydrogenase family)